MSSEESKNITVPEEFSKIINDFTSDILITFPEYGGIIGKWWNQEKDGENKVKQELFVFKHCLKVFPERFFDILYKNAEIFLNESDTNTEFLPGIVFKVLWNCDISDKTKDTIWKYLQLILFAVMGSVHNSSDLGDTAKLFEAIDEEELKSKLQETLEGMQNLFEENSNENKDNLGENFGINMENMPKAEELHEHINSMMGGKLGKIAMELAEETANDLNLDLENTESAKDVFQTLFKNPTKLMSMVKNIGTKLDDKIKSGEIKESELMEEGMELLNKMKNMPGLGNMQQMFSKMGLGKGGKINMNAMEAQMNRNMNAAKMKERMKAKVEQKAREKELNSVGQQNNQNNLNNNGSGLSDEEIIKVFSTGEKVERTPRGAKPLQPATTTINKKNKKSNDKKKK